MFRGRSRRARFNASPFSGAKMRFCADLSLLLPRLYLVMSVTLMMAQPMGTDGPNDEALGKVWWAHVQYLADDSMKGRLTGSEEYLKAAAYVVEKFKSYGLHAGGSEWRVLSAGEFRCAAGDCG